MKRNGVMHNRRLALSKGGKSIEGIDRIEPPSGRLRLKQDLPFAIHFHLHPDCRAKAASGPVPHHDAHRASLDFRAEGAEVSIEESLYFAESSGPRPGLQIVLRGATFGETEVRWSVKAEAALSKDAPNAGA